LVFANSGTLSGAIIVMVFFSLLVQAAEGSSYGIVPYVDPPATGSIAGIVGAGGNSGAVAFGLGFRQLGYNQAFVVMGGTILVSSVLSLFIFIKGHAGLIMGQDDPTPEKEIQTLSVPEPDAEKADEEEDQDA
jgi:NNP family nitrate/nitrite transporter-like MFS transporter